MTHGELYRTLRQSKGITLAAVAAETGLTASFVSRFERGLSTVSVVNFEALLTAINITQAEFSSAQARAGMPGELPAGERQLWQARHEMPFLAPFLHQALYDKQAAQALLAKRDQALAAYRAVPTRNRHFVYLFYQGLYLAVSAPHTPVPVRWTLPVTQYLQQVDQWGVYELRLFQLFMLMMPTDVNLRLLKIAVKLSRQLGELRQYQDMLFNLLVGDLTVQLTARAFDAAAAVLALLDTTPLHGAEPLVRRFLHGWVALKSGDAAGRQQCETALALMRAVELPALADTWQARLSGLLADPEYDIVLINL